GAVADRHAPPPRHPPRPATLPPPGTRGRGAPHPPQRLQVPPVRGQRHLAVAVEIDHPLVHRAPDHLPPPLAGPQPPHAELPRVVDHRLDPKYPPEFVVHLQPVILHPMLDPRTGMAPLLAVGEHLAVAPGMEPPPQEAQNSGR